MFINFRLVGSARFLLYSVMFFLEFFVFCPRNLSAIARTCGVICRGLNGKGAVLSFLFYLRNSLVFCCVLGVLCVPRVFYLGSTCKLLFWKRHYWVFNLCFCLVVCGALISSSVCSLIVRIVISGLVFCLLAFGRCC